MMKKRILVFATALMTCTAFAGTSLGQTSTNISDFPLSKAVPADVFIAVMAKHNPEREFLDAYWAEVWDAFKQSGLMEDVWDMMTDDVPDEDLDAIEEARERFSGLIGAIDWGDLFKDEMLYTARMSNRLQPPSPYEGLLIGRMSGKLAEQNHEKFKALMQGVADAVGEQNGSGIFVVGECKIEGIPMTTLGVAEAPNLICIGHKKDLLFVSLFNRSLLQDALKLMRGKSNDGLISTSRFKDSIAKLPPAEDVVVFFNIGSMMTQVKEMIGSAVPPPPGGEEGENGTGYDESVAGVHAVLSLIDDINMFDYMVSVEWTDGYRVFSESITQLTPGVERKPLYEVFKGGTPIDDFAKYIPKEATDFWCSTGIDFAALYRYAINFIETKLPSGKQTVIGFKDMQKQNWELDIEKDVLSLFEGNIQTITAGNNTVIMMKVTDEAKLNAQLDRLFAWINKEMGEDSGMMIADISVEEHPGFRQIRHPMLMMMGGGMAPVIGTADGYFFFGTSDRFLAKCFKTAAGKHPNITKSKRWQAEALARKGGGPVESIKFTDETRLGEELQAGLGMFSVMMGFMNMAGGEGGLPPEVQEALSTISPMLAKLGVVLGQLDFFQSSSAYTVNNGKSWHTYSVQNYKKPEPKSPSGETDDEDAESETKASL